MTSMCLFCARGLVSLFYIAHSSCTDSNGLDKETKESTFHVDVKSEELRDILREVLKDVHGISLMEDKPTVCPFLY